MARGPISPEMNTEVLIAGAGPTGLAMALWLARLQVPFRIVDRHPQPAAESRALAVHARTLELYAQAGFADTAIANGVKLEALNLWARGKRAAHVDLGDLGAGLSPFPYVLILAQDRHERILGEHLAALGVRIERSVALTGFEERGNSITARLEHADGTKETCECAWLAGCDGAHSKVRETLGLAFPGGTYERLFYVADVQATGPVVDGELNVALDESDLLAVFPLVDEGNVRLIGTIRAQSEDEAKQLSWDDVSRGILEHLGVTVRHVSWFSTYRVHHRVTDRFRVGRAFVLGDAAHIHSPVGGQGMNTGIGDAVNLAWKLAMVVKGQADARLLDTYEPERIAFAQRLVATTDRAFTFASSDGPLARIVRMDLVPHALPALFSIEASRRYFFRTLSQILIHYPHSTLSAGHAGAIHGGDRLPWTGGNFKPLESMDWQAHVYGTAPAPLTAACREIGLALHVFPWNDAASRAGLAQDALYVVRPDGYVGLAAATPDGAELQRYFRERRPG